MSGGHDDVELNAQLAELKKLVATVRDYQERNGLKTAQLLRKFPGLGSDKTFASISKGDPEKLDELDLERWALEYRGVVNAIATLEEQAARDEVLYDDLGLARQLRVAVSAVMRENGNNRLVLLTGPSGSGKSKAGEIVQQRYGKKRVARCEANEAWRTSPAAMLDDMLAALGKRAQSQGTSTKLNLLIETLNPSRICMIIDEGHHMNPPCLNLLKTLINRTPGEFVILAMDTLFRRLEHSNYEEARQLTQNRLYQRIQVRNCELEDIALYVERRTGVKLEDSMKTMIRDKSARHGHMSFTKLVCQQAAMMAANETIDAEHIARAVAKVEQTR